MGRVYHGHSQNISVRSNWDPRSTTCVVYGKGGHGAEGHGNHDAGQVCIDSYGNRLITDPGSPPGYPADFFGQNRYEYYNASALGHKACRDNRSVLYQRVPRLFDDLALARGDGRHPRLLRGLGRVDLLILDDWGPDRLNPEQRRDLMEIVEDRHQNASILITSQLPLAKWHDVIGEPTFADAILDRIVHNAHRIDLDWPSMRKTIAENIKANTVDHLDGK